MAGVCLGFASSALAQDGEVTNYKSGISLTLSGVKNTDWATEDHFSDPLILPRQTIYIKESTQLSFAHNALNLRDTNANNGYEVVGASDAGGTIRYSVDGDGSWARNWSGAGTLWPAYSGPLTFGTLTYPFGGSVLGTTGSNGQAESNQTAFYWRGLTETVGTATEEWHTITVADDDAIGGQSDDEWGASDGRVCLFVVNPKTPIIQPSITGNGQFYTSPAKPYFTPRICPQTTWIAAGTGTVSITLRDINGGNISYRINGGASVNVGASSVVLAHTTFAAGTNTLECWFTATPTVIRARTIVRDSTHPSLAEQHGDLLWRDEGWARVSARIDSAPNSAAYVTARDSSFYHKRNVIQTTFRDGQRKPLNHSDAAALLNAIAALKHGYATVGSGSTLSYGEAARRFVLENPRTWDAVGVEKAWSATALPGRSQIYRGYYDFNDFADTFFAYDILVANYRSDQVSGGITAIEDAMLRDCFASFVYQSIQVMSKWANYGDGEMWPIAHRIAALVMAVGMPKYDSPAYGASGFDGVTTTTYARCPFPATNYTWRQVFLDLGTRTSYPELERYFGIEEYLFLSDGTWTDRIGYYDRPLMGHCLWVAANIMKIHLNRSLPRYELSMTQALAGTLMPVKSPGEGPGQFGNYGVYNWRFRTAIGSNIPHWELSANPTEFTSEMAKGNPYTFLWYQSDPSNAPLTANPRRNKRGMGARILP